MAFPRNPLSLAALSSMLILAACSSTATPISMTSPEAPADTSTPALTATAGQTPIPVTTETPFTIESADLPSSYVVPLPDGAVARLGRGLVNEQTISPNGNTLAVGTSTGVVAFDTSTLELLWSVRTAERVSAIAWSHDSARLAAGLYDGSTLVWEAKSGHELLNLPSTNGTIDNLDWTPDGLYLLSTASRGVGIIRDGSTGDVLHTLTYSEQSTVSSYGAPITLMWGALSPDGHTYATHYGYDGTDGPRMRGETFVLWDIPSGRQIRVVEGSPQRLKWSPDSGFLASESSYSGTLTIWDALTGQIAANIPMDDPRFNVYWSPGGTKLFAGAPYSNPVVIDVAAQKVLFDIDHDLYGYDFLGWSASGDQFTVYDGQSKVTTFDTRTGQIVESRSSGSDRYFLTTGVRGEQLGVWDVKAGAFTKTLLTGTDSILSLSWSPDGKRLGTTSHDEIAVWDVASAQPEKAWNVSFGRALLTFQASGLPAWSPDGKSLALINQEKIELIDSHTGEPKLQLDETADQIEWLPDGNRIVFGYWGAAFRIFDMASSQISQILQPGGEPGIQIFASSPDGKQFITVNPSGGVTHWNATTGGHLDSISLSGFNPKHEPFTAISPDLTMLATTNQYHEFPRQCDKALVRLTESDTILYTIGDNDLMADGCPYLATWSPDSKTLAITYEVSDYGPHIVSNGMLFGETGGMIALYDAKTGQRLKILRGHSSIINTLAFSPDGKWLASGSDDGTVILWDMTR